MPVNRSSVDKRLKTVGACGCTELKPLEIGVDHLAQVAHHQAVGVRRCRVQPPGARGRGEVELDQELQLRLRVGRFRVPAQHRFPRLPRDQRFGAHVHENDAIGTQAQNDWRELHQQYSTHDVILVNRQCTLVGLVEVDEAVYRTNLRAMLIIAHQIESAAVGRQVLADIYVELFHLH